MDIMELLESRRSSILQQAATALERACLTHYTLANAETNVQRLATLYDLIVRCIRTRDVTPIVDFANELATERFNAGFDLKEVQIGFNVLEEALWQQIVIDCEGTQLAEALGLVSTVHGVGKDTLARKYVALATHSKPQSLDMQALFKGTDGV